MEPKHTFSYRNAEIFVEIDWPVINGRLSKLARVRVVEPSNPPDTLIYEEFSKDLYPALGRGLITLLERDIYRTKTDTNVHRAIGKAYAELLDKENETLEGIISCGESLIFQLDHIPAIKMDGDIHRVLGKAFVELLDQDNNSGGKVQQWFETMDELGSFNIWSD